nr:hypothetical protein [Erwinia sp. Ejp617]
MNVETVETKKYNELRIVDKEYHEALGWLVFTRYRNESDLVSSMELANGFCKEKGKMATRYESERGTEITETWACQTPPKLSDSDVLRAVYCHFIAIAPRYSVDISDKQKQRAEDIYSITLIRKGIEYPVGGSTRNTKGLLFLGFYQSMKIAINLIRYFSGSLKIANRSLRRGYKGSDAQ